MLPRLLDFTHALRAAGIPVAVSEGMDALAALDHVDLTDRAAVRESMAATMIKTDSQRPAFDTLFDLYWGTGRGPEALVESDERDLGVPVDADAFAAELGAALGSGEGAMRELARRAVALFGRVEGSPSGVWYSNYEVMRALDLNRVVAQAIADADDDDPLDAVAARDRVRRDADAFRAAVLSEIRRRMAEYRGPEAVASYAVAPPLENLDFLSATADLAELRRAVRPLARKLAARIAMKRRRSTRGQLDMRRTVRHSLSSGGVPLETVMRHRSPHRPDLFVLCDVSSSVARFARFSLMLTHALKSQFSKVRSFAFVDKIDEVTRFFEHEDFEVAVNRMNAEADVVWIDGHSDYGSSLEQFLEVYGSEVTPKTTVLILGDARNNYRARKAWVLKELGHRARHVYWLNPEPRRDWDTGDSAASEYEAVVDEMVEVRNLRHLQRFIEEVL
ncbi:MAG TPA: VWA domain-containing protein [Actinomycetota bacterium]|nr:VWA domain-containing protein [Actinomycetota bacterium]